MTSSSQEQHHARNVTVFLAYSIADVVRISGIGRTLIFSEIKAGNLIARKCGRRTIVLHVDLDRWLESLIPTASTIQANGIDSGATQ